MRARRGRRLFMARHGRRTHIRWPGGQGGGQRARTQGPANPVGRRRRGLTYGGGTQTCLPRPIDHSFRPSRRRCSRLYTSRTSRIKNAHEPAHSILYCHHRTWRGRAAPATGRVATSAHLGGVTQLHRPWLGLPPTPGVATRSGGTRATGGHQSAEAPPISPALAGPLQPSSSAPAPPPPRGRRGGADTIHAIAAEP